MSFFANDLLYLFFLIIVAVAAWLLGKRDSISLTGESRRRSDEDYFLGLNFLLNDEPDAAVDFFIQSLELNSHSLKSHRALGALLRRRGKVDKSISIYQRLLTRPGLSDSESSGIKIDLSRSYIAAGLLDRAERLLEEIQQAPKDLRREALELTLYLFQLEKDWERAIHSVLELISLCPIKDRKQYQFIASHFYCEMVEDDIENSRFQVAKKSLKKASKICKSNVRVSFLAAKVEMSLKNYKAAIKAFDRIAQQDERFFPEVYSYILRCYQLHDSQHVEKVIQDTLGQDNPSSRVLINISDSIERSEGATGAILFLLKHMKTKPSLRLMARTLELLGQQGEAEEQEKYLLFHKILNDYLSQRLMYECHNCGFEAKGLHWLCPSCSKWGTVGLRQGIADE